MKNETKPKRAGGRTKADRASPRTAAVKDKQVGRMGANKVVSMTSTEAQNNFGRMLDKVAREYAVFITRHNATQAVVISAERYEALTGAKGDTLNTLTAEFDELLARMQSSDARSALRDAFRAAPAELSLAAAAAASRRAG